MNIKFNFKAIKTVSSEVYATTKNTVVATADVAKEASIVGGLYAVDKTVVGAIAATEAMETASKAMNSVAQRIAQRMLDRRVAAGR